MQLKVNAFHGPQITVTIEEFLFQAHEFNITLPLLKKTLKVTKKQKHFCRYTSKVSFVEQSDIKKEKIRTKLSVEV